VWVRVVEVAAEVQRRAAKATDENYDANYTRELLPVDKSRFSFPFLEYERVLQ